MSMIIAGTGTGDATDAVIRAEFEDALATTTSMKDPRISGLFLEVQSNKRQEVFHVWESVPSPELQVRGNAVAEDSFGEQNVTVVNYRWSKELSWFDDDAADDMTGRMVTRAQSLAQRYDELDMRILVQIAETTTDDKLLPSISSLVAYDGTALYSSSTRFGNASGNTVSGSVGTGSYASAAEINTDYWAVIARFLSFQDTESNPYWSPDVLVGQNLLILHRSGDVKYFSEAFEQEFIFRKDSINSVVDVAVGAGAGVSNILIQGSKYSPHCYPSQRLSDDANFHVFVTGLPVRPFVKLIREPLTLTSFNKDNDRDGRRYVKSGINFTMRAGWGIFEPRCAMKLSNA